MAETDYTQRFLFEHTAIRGERVCLDEQLRATLSTHQYPEALKVLLGEMVAAAVLLSGMLKFTGTFTLQARSAGPVTLLMVECTDQKRFRALARWKNIKADDNTPESLEQWLPDGQMVITVDPERGKRYQSIIVLDKPTLADCVTAYFRQSEQLPTKLWLASDGEKASGMLLQSLPDCDKTAPEKNAALDQWEHFTLLAQTIKKEELLSLDNTQLLYRLFHGSDIRLFDADPVFFQCGCSRERTSLSLQTLSREEIKNILDEEGRIDMQCQFCNRHYYYTPEDVESLLKNTH